MMAAAESRRARIELGWGAMCVQVEGPPGYPWLVLSNSLAADLSMWEGQIAFLSQTHRILRYDTRGHGASGSVSTPYSFADLAGDALALMDHFEVEAATFVGLSLGGMTGLKLALDYPERISRLVCCNARASTPDPARAGWNARAEAVRAGGLAAVLDDTISRWLLPQTRQRAPETVAAIRRMILGTSVAGYLGCIEAIKSADFLDRLAELACPVAYIAGEQDTGVPPAAMQEMAERTPGATFAVVPHCAHLANIDNSEIFTQTVGRALSA